MYHFSPEEHEAFAGGLTDAQQPDSSSESSDEAHMDIIFKDYVVDPDETQLDDPPAPPDDPPAPADTSSTAAPVPLPLPVHSVPVDAIDPSITRSPPKPKPGKKKGHGTMSMHAHAKETAVARWTQGFMPSVDEVVPNFKRWWQDEVLQDLDILKDPQRTYHAACLYKWHTVDNVNSDLPGMARVFFNVHAWIVSMLFPAEQELQDFVDDHAMRDPGASQYQDNLAVDQFVLEYMHTMYTETLHYLEELPEMVCTEIFLDNIRKGWCSKEGVKYWVCNFVKQLGRVLGFMRSSLRPRAWVDLIYTPLSEYVNDTFFMWVSTWMILTLMEECRDHYVPLKHSRIYDQLHNTVDSVYTYAQPFFVNVEPLNSIKWEWPHMASELQRTMWKMAKDKGWWDWEETKYTPAKARMYKTGTVAMTAKGHQMQIWNFWDTTGKETPVQWSDLTKEWMQAFLAAMDTFFELYFPRFRLDKLFPDDLDHLDAVGHAAWIVIWDPFWTRMCNILIGTSAVYRPPYDRYYPFGEMARLFMEHQMCKKFWFYFDEHKDGGKANTRPMKLPPQDEVYTYTTYRPAGVVFAKAIDKKNDPPQQVTRCINALNALVLYDHEQTMHGLYPPTPAPPPPYPISAPQPLPLPLPAAPVPIPEPASSSTSAPPPPFAPKPKPAKAKPIPAENVGFTKAEAELHQTLLKKFTGGSTYNPADVTTAEIFIKKYPNFTKNLKQALQNYNNREDQRRRYVLQLQASKTYNEDLFTEVSNFIRASPTEQNSLRLTLQSYVLRTKPTQIAPPPLPKPAALSDIPLAPAPAPTPAPMAAPVHPPSLAPLPPDPMVLAGIGQGGDPPIPPPPLPPIPPPDPIIPPGQPAVPPPIPPPPPPPSPPPPPPPPPGGNNGGKGSGKGKGRGTGYENVQVHHGRFVGADSLLHDVFEFDYVGQPEQQRLRNVFYSNAQIYY